MRCITIVKETTTGNTSFQFTESQGSTIQFSLSNGQSRLFDFAASPAVITEQPNSDWNLIDITCHTSENVQAFADVSSGTVTIFLGESSPVSFPISQRPVGVPQPQDLNDFFGDQTSSSAYCIFLNDPVRQPPNVGGVFPAILGRPHATPTKQAAAAGGTGTLAPPRTGDAGLNSDGDNSVNAALFMLGAVTVAAGAAATAARRKRHQA